MPRAKKPLPDVNIRGTHGEPWVDLPDGRALADWSREDLIAYNQINRQVEKARLFRDAFGFLTDNRISGDYFEFGCHRCRTFRMALTEARRHGLAAMRFLAFDSFEGLPEPKSATSVEIWKRGALTTSEEEFMRMVREHGIYVDQVRTIRGFYTESLSDTLSKELLNSGRKAMLVTVDCDLYESAVPVFRFIDPLIQEGAVLYIDDLFAGYKGSPAKGVAAAFLEYQRTARWKFVRHQDIGWWGRSYIAYLHKNKVEGVL